MKNPHISVVVTTHLRAQLLVRALNSLLLQTYQDFEIIVVSDVFDLDTLDIIKSTLRHTDTLIMNPKLIGPSESRNIGAAVAQGTWILFLDDDDALEKECLENFITQENLNSSDVYFTDYIKIVENRATSKILSTEQGKIGAFEFSSILYRNYIPNSCIILRADIARKTHFDSRLDSHEDWDWLINLGRTTTFKHLPFIGPIIYEDLSDSRNQKAKDSKEIAYDYLSIYRKWRTSDLRITGLRCETLKKLGLPVDEKFL